MVAFEIRTSETLSKIVLEQSFGFHNNNLDSKLSDIFQQQISDICCLSKINMNIMFSVSDNSNLKPLYFIWCFSVVYN